MNACRLPNNLFIGSDRLELLQLFWCMLFFSFFFLPSLLLFLDLYHHFQNTLQDVAEVLCNLLVIWTFSWCNDHQGLTFIWGMTDSMPQKSCTTNSSGGLSISITFASTQLAIEKCGSKYIILPISFFLHFMVYNLFPNVDASVSRPECQCYLHC